jgi:hypothetical protein
VSDLVSVLSFLRGATDRVSWVPFIAVLGQTLHGQEKVP